jgi:hypothetical protein
VKVYISDLARVIQVAILIQVGRVIEIGRASDRNARFLGNDIGMPLDGVEPRAFKAYLEFTRDILPLEILTRTTELRCGDRKKYRQDR